MLRLPARERLARLDGDLYAPLAGPPTALIVGLAALAALAVGLLAAVASPLAVAAGLGGAAVLAFIWRWPVTGLFLFVLVIATVPFGVIPVQVGVQLTFVDAVLISTLLGFLANTLFERGARERFSVGTTGSLLLGFVVVAVAALVAGSVVAPLTPEVARRFAKLVASLLVFIVGLNLLTTRSRLERLTRWLMFAGAFQGAIGAALMAFSPLTQLGLLQRLSIIGYPAGEGVLRYLPGANNSYTTQLRAIGTSVDPNVFGGTLMLALTLMVVHWASPAPVLRKWLLVLLSIPTLAGLLLSLSRASWVGLAAGLLLVGGLRYRRVLVLGGLGLVALLLSPVGDDLLARFVSGFTTADRATAFRFGEYGNALTLIRRYPLLGIGFGSSPDIDVTAGVSSVYLLVGEQTGLIGLALFLGAVGAAWWAGLKAFRRAEDARLEALLGGFLAAISGALVAGLLDHYFANQAFPHAVALFWLYVAAMLSGARLVPHRSSQPSPSVPRPAAPSPTRTSPGARRRGPPPPPPPAV